ncbi:beta-1,3-galactosyltransferase 6 [Copidosoma floridanum]|uniref:beta-1,3-galactosyltransferase 6 n=1 Tax=Copidosoma floridanum TaxID=29053 RepID=UPI0006C93C46|nr:beta-1,3-galactosyltransferase 6 [Copidosoma floridanum]XP_014215113.1 beta-1,3-galactosyltransferase 6 [Copidosoma floridanum]
MPKIRLSMIPALLIIGMTTLSVHYLASRRCPGDEDDASKPKYRLIVIVLSAPENSERRDVIRKTWLSPRPLEVKSLFPIGTTKLRPEQRETVESENQKHQDLIFLPKLYDAYGTITKKVLQSFAHVITNYEFDFLLKTDDDTFALIDLILKDLNRWQNKGLRKELYWGYFDGRARARKTGPWKEINWFLCDYYLPYALGGGYVLSYNLVKFIAQNADVLKLYNSEDVSVGLWLAPLANIERRHDIRFDTEYRSRGCLNSYYVTHKQSIQEMKKLQDLYTRTGNICSHEVQNYYHYHYNWTVPPSKCCERKPGIR